MVHIYIFFSLYQRVPIGLEDVSTYPDLFAELVRRKWTPSDLKKLAGENLIRVFTKVEQVIHLQNISVDSKSEHGC